MPPGEYSIFLDLRFLIVKEKKLDKVMLGPFQFMTLNLKKFKWREAGDKCQKVLTVPWGKKKARRLEERHDNGPLPLSSQGGHRA